MRAIMPVVFGFIFISAQAVADSGVVVKEDVCGTDNFIVETSDGWYVSLERYHGAYLSEGDNVFGNLKTFGFENINNEEGDDIRVYIEDYDGSIGGAFEELCQ